MTDTEQQLPPIAPSVARVIRDYHGDGDFTWTDVQVGVLVQAVERVQEMLHEHSEDAAGLWAAKRDSSSAAERWESEYWRGQMNGLHHVLTQIDEEGISAD